MVIIAVYAHAYTAGDQLLGAPLSTKLSGLMPVALVRAHTTPLRIVCSRVMCKQSVSDLLRRKRLTAMHAQPRNALQYERCVYTMHD